MVSRYLTASELVERATLVGGIGRVREVLRALWVSCTPQGLTQSLDALQGVPTAQRLGALLVLDRRHTLASRVAEWLKNKPLRLVPLEHDQTGWASPEIDSTFKVRLSGAMRSANT